MQMVKKVLILILTLWLALILFMPKQELYFKLEQELKKEDVAISAEKIKEGWFTLRLETPNVYVKGIKVATVDEVSFFTLLFYSKVTVKGIVLDSSLKQYAPDKIDKVKIKHSVLFPSELSVSANGGFGDAKGKVSFSERNVTIHFSEIDKMKALKSKLKKGEEGWVYETSF